MGVGNFRLSENDSIYKAGSIYKIEITRDAEEWETLDEVEYLLNDVIQEELVYIKSEINKEFKKRFKGFWEEEEKLDGDLNVFCKNKLNVCIYHTFDCYGELLIGICTSKNPNIYDDTELNEEKRILNLSNKHFNSYDSLLKKIIKDNFSNVYSPTGAWTSTKI